ncbi:MAG: winged helix-turn-helix domain-containing protein [Bacteroidota bacterium]
MNWKLLTIFIAGCLFILLAAFVSKKATDNDFEAAKEIIIMRKIAHDILLYTGDSTSQVLPVNQVSANEFQIPFASSFSFKPDSLINIINKLIVKNNLTSNYIVNVLDCSSQKVIFGYAILGSEQNNIVPCSGRAQPSMRYCINIKFQERIAKGGTSNTLYLSGIAIIFAGLFIAGRQQYKNKKNIATSIVSETVLIKEYMSIGNYRFYPEEQSLAFNNEKIILTSKESKLLSVFASQPNQILDRNELQKIWEDDGVIVGRSLDMFVSKLRKKLEHDPNVKLTNIHGKGYRLEIQDDNLPA